MPSSKSSLPSALDRTTWNERDAITVTRLTLPVGFALASANRPLGIASQLTEGSVGMLPRPTIVALSRPARMRQPDPYLTMSGLGCGVQGRRGLSPAAWLGAVTWKIFGWYHRPMQPPTVGSLVGRMFPNPCGVCSRRPLQGSGTTPGEQPREATDGVQRQPIGQLAVAIQSAQTMRPRQS